jgi:hypothetical protein
MRTGLLAVACAAIMTMSSGVARAEVDGLTFDITVVSTVSGQFTGVLSFFDDATWTLDVDGSAEGGSGTYTQATSTSITAVNAVGDNGAGYVGTFKATVDDPKQLPGLRGLFHRFRNTPATITGTGFGNAGDVFKFNGTEILP